MGCETTQRGQGIKALRDEDRRYGLGTRSSQEGGARTNPSWQRWSNSKPQQLWARPVSSQRHQALAPLSAAESRSSQTRPAFFFFTAHLRLLDNAYHSLAAPPHTHRLLHHLHTVLHVLIPMQQGPIQQPGGHDAHRKRKPRRNRKPANNQRRRTSQQRQQEIITNECNPAPQSLLLALPPTLRLPFSPSFRDSL